MRFPGKFYPLLFALGLSGVIQPAFAQTTWTGQIGDWFTATNWSAGIPTSTTDAVIANDGTAQILSGTAAAQSLTLGNATTGSPTGTLTVSGTGSFLNATSLTIESVGYGALNVLSGGAVTDGTCTVLGSPPSGGNRGVVNVDGTGSTWTVTSELDVYGQLAIQNGGAVVTDTTYGFGSIALDGAGSNWSSTNFYLSVGSDGLFAVSNGALLTTNQNVYIGDTTFLSSVTVTDAGSHWENDFPNSVFTVGYLTQGLMSVTNGGTVSAREFDIGDGSGGTGQVFVTGGGSVTAKTLNVRSSGNTLGVPALFVQFGGEVSASTTTLFGGGSVWDNGDLQSDTVTLDSGSVLCGSGTVTGDLTNSGSVQPGEFHVGTLTVAGNFTQTSAGTLVMEINGAVEPLDLLSVSGSATLDGTLEVRFTNGFLPKAGQVFDLINVTGSRSATFAQIIFPDLVSGFQYSAKFVGGHYQLTALSDGASALGLQNISTRDLVGSGEDVLIAGFIVTGGVNKTVLIRGLGPSLASSGLSGLLANPYLELYGPTGSKIIANDNWMDSLEEKNIMASGLAPENPQESAIYVTLAPGSYTAILSGVDASSGIGIVEAYDLSPSTDANLGNISTRGLVSTGDNVMIGGFIANDQDSILLQRALGPSLAADGVTDPLPDPTLELHNADGDTIAFNNDWADTDAADIENTGYAPLDGKESAILTTLPMGQYTAIVSPNASSPDGVGLFEVYNLR